MSKIVIKNIKAFVAPLDSLKNSISAIILSKKDNTFIVNAKSEDSTQMANIIFKPEVIEITEGADTVDKIGIYNLNDFLTVLTLFSDINAVTLTVTDNQVSIRYNDKQEMNYVLSVLSVITEGPAGPKNPLTFLAEFEIDNSFIKKIKTISTSINQNILKFKAEGGKLSYTIGSKKSQTHSYKEVLLDTGVAEDFEVSVTIRDDKKDNFRFLYEGCKYRIGIHAKTIQLEAITTDYEKLRYFIAPLAPTAQ